jgi:YNFM family putative membrane transporter
MAAASSLARSSSFWPLTLALGLGSFVVFTNLYITQPMLPYMVKHFGVTPLLAGQSFTFATATLALSLLIFGPLSDVFGRKRLMMASTVAAVSCTLALAWVDDLHSLLAWRALQGVFLAGLPAIALAYLREQLAAGEFRTAVGVYISANSLGGIGGRLIGGFLIEHFTLSQSFLMMAALSLLLLIPVMVLLPASPAVNGPRRLPRPKVVAANIASHLGNPTLRWAYIIGGLNFFVFVNQFSYATFRLSKEPYALAPSALGMLFLTYLSGTLGAAWSGRWFRRLTPPQVMLLGIVLLMLGSLVTLAESLWVIVIGFLINALGFFIAHANASGWVSRQAEHTPATASSVYLVCYYLGASSGGYYLDPFWRQFGWSGVVMASWLVLAITAWCAWQLQRVEQQRLEQQGWANRAA